MVFQFYLTGFPTIYWSVPMIFWYVPTIFRSYPIDFWLVPIFFWYFPIGYQYNWTKKFWETAKKSWERNKKIWEPTKNWCEPTNKSWQPCIEIITIYNIILLYFQSLLCASTNLSVIFSVYLVPVQIMDVHYGIMHGRSTVINLLIFTAFVINSGRCDLDSGIQVDAIYVDFKAVFNRDLPICY